MEDSMPHAPARRMQHGRRPSPRSVFAMIAAVAAIIVVAIVAMSPSEPAAPRTSTVEDGGLEWDTVVVIPEGDLSTVEASVQLDDHAFPVADGADDRFVLYQLAGGRFDTNEHVDDRVAERVLGFDEDDGFLFAPSEDGLRVRSAAQPRSGEYTLSLDGSIEYADIPSGTWELRAYVVDRSGTWDGPVVTTSVEVR